MLAKEQLVGSSAVLKGELVDPGGQLVWAGALAAGGECAAFRRWVDDLPAKGNEALMQLRQYGFAEDLDRLAAELRRALGQRPAGPLARVVGQRLLDVLANRAGAACFLFGEG